MTVSSLKDPVLPRIKLSTGLVWDVDESTYSIGYGKMQISNKE